MSRSAATITTTTAETAETAETAARLRLAVGRLARRMRHQDRSGLPLTQSAVLATLGRRGPMTLGDLASCEQVAPPTMTRVVGLLEDQGLVKRRTDDADRRVVRVDLSAKGRRQIRADRDRRVAWLAGRLEGLSSTDRARLEAALDVLEELAGVDEATGPVPTVDGSTVEPT